MKRRDGKGGGGGSPRDGAATQRDCGLCVRRSRGCGPAVADQLINGSIWSCRPQVAGSRTLGAGTNCGSATDKITQHVFFRCWRERCKHA